MGIWENVTGAFDGSGTRTVPLTLRGDEREITRAVASWRPGSATSVGGDLVLTDRRLAFTPLDTRDVVPILSWTLTKAGAPSIATRAVDMAAHLVDGHDLGSLTDVRPGESATLLRPPTLVVSASDGSQITIGILIHRRSMNASAANVAARDRMIAAIAEAVKSWNTG